MKIISLSKDQIAFVDDEDFEQVSSLTWHAKWNRGAKRWDACHSFGYSKGPGQPRGCRQLSLSHFIMGKPPKGMCVDHKNGDQLDNRRDNLRFCTRSQNSQNAKKKCTSSLLYKGIKRRIGGTFQTRLSVDGRRISLGSAFKTQEDAAHAYNEGALIHYGEFARLNVIPAEEAA